MAGACLSGSLCASRLMLFVGGPSAVGAGKIVDVELTEPIRWASGFLSGISQ